jgi:methyl-accepting chemotaxis protein
MAIFSELAKQMNGKTESDDLVIDVGAISKSIDELKALYREVNSARETYTDAIEAVATKANVSKTVLRQLVKSASENTEAEVVLRSNTLVDLIETLSLY